jgi:hypothetical protein
MIHLCLHRSAAGFESGRFGGKIDGRGNQQGQGDDGGDNCQLTHFRTHQIRVLVAT